MVLPREPPAGLTVAEADLYRHLVAHIDTEVGLVESYEQLGRDTGSAYIEFVGRLIAEDERRHHRLFAEWAAALVALAELREQDVGAVPVPNPEPDPAQVLSRIDALLAIEQHDLGEIERLRRTVRDVRNTTLWPVLLDAMALDTEKHLRLLRFVRDHARRPLRYDHPR
jgi:hypothetical protein